MFPISFKSCFFEQPMLSTTCSFCTDWLDISRHVANYSAQPSYILRFSNLNLLRLLLSSTVQYLPIHYESCEKCTHTQKNVTQSNLRSFIYVSCFAIESSFWLSSSCVSGSDPCSKIETLFSIALPTLHDANAQYNAVLYCTAQYYEWTHQMMMYSAVSR